LFNDQPGFNTRIRYDDIYRYVVLALSRIYNKTLRIRTWYGHYYRVYVSLFSLRWCARETEQYLPCPFYIWEAAIRYDKRAAASLGGFETFPSNPAAYRPISFPLRRCLTVRRSCYNIFVLFSFSFRPLFSSYFSRTLRIDFFIKRVSDVRVFERRRFIIYKNFEKCRRMKRSESGAIILYPKTLNNI